MAGTIQDAVWGAIAGATIGASRRGSPPKRLVFYDPVPARMSPHDALDAWVVMVDGFRRGSFARNLAGPYRWHLLVNREEYAFARANFEEGFTAPMSGWLRNPLNDGALAIGRALVWGLTAESARDALQQAFCDASVDHCGDGAITPAMLAGMAFVARQGADLASVLAWAKLVAPPQTASARALLIGEATAADGKDSSALAVRLAEAGFRDNAFEAPLTLARIIYSLATGDKTEDSLAMVAGMGQNADDAGIAVGVLGCLMHGPLSGEWLSPLGKQFVAGHGLAELDPPLLIQDLAEMVAGASLPAVPVETDVLAIRELFSRRPNSQSKQIGNVVAGANYNPLISRKTGSAELVLSFENLGDAPRTIEPRLEAGPGTEVAAKLSSCQIDPGKSVRFPAIIRLLEDVPSAVATLHLGDQSLQLPVRLPIQWHVCGPFDNNADTGFDRVLKCEDQLGEEEVFMGRSRIPTRWKPVEWEHGGFPAESYFQGMPGILVLAARFKFRQTGELKVVAAGSPGVIVTVNRERILRYQDTHAPIARAVAPYVAKFSILQDNLIIVKLIRSKEPAADLQLYFLGEMGQVVRPLASLPLVRE